MVSPSTKWCHDTAVPPPYPPKGGYGVRWHQNASALVPAKLETKKKARNESMKIIQIVEISNPNSTCHLFALTNTGRIFIGSAVDYRPKRKLVKYDWDEVTLPADTLTRDGK